MGANCCIVGSTEKETLHDSLQWVSTWAAGLARDLLIIQECLDSIGGVSCHGAALHNYYSDNISKEQLIAELDANNTLIGGLSQKLRNAYPEDEDTEGSLLGKLASDFDRLKKQCEGELPIPVDGWGREIPFDECINRLEKEGNPLPKEYIRVKIAGNGKYFRRRTGSQIYAYVGMMMHNEWLSHNKEQPFQDCHFALVFQDQEAVDAIATKTIDAIATKTIDADVPDHQPHPHKRETISALEHLLRTFKNMRVFFLKDSIEEFPLSELKKQGQ